MSAALAEAERPKAMSDQTTLQSTAALPAKVAAHAAGPICWRGGISARPFLILESGETVLGRLVPEGNAACRLRAIVSSRAGMR